jgi:WD40 repeat protein/Ca2+-binding EF-hand superfamily protein
MVKSISFDMEYAKVKDYKGMSDDHPIEDSANTSNFKCLPFIISDVSATIKRVYNEKGEIITYGDENLKYQEIYRGLETEITCIAVSPKKNLIAVGTRGQPPKNMIRKKVERRGDSILKEKRFEYRAYVQLFHYPNHMKTIKEENKKREEDVEKKKKILKKDDKKNKLYPGKTKNKTIEDDDELNENRYTNCYKKYFAADTYPTCLEFSPSDNTLMVGTSFQKILPLNSENINAPLNDKQSILQIKEVADKEDKNAEIKEIQFSPDKKHFAATDNMGRIGLFRLEGIVWSLVARYHFKGQINILSFCFNETGTRIYTITSDRYLEEFKLAAEGETYQNYSFPMNMPGNKVDNNNSNININNMNNTNNKVYISIKIEDDCNMTSIVWYPLSHQKEREIVISNDAYKIKAVNVNDSLNTANSLSIIKTSLGPCFGGPIQVMRVIPGKDKTKRLIAFATREKVLGLMCLPIDGNPFRYMGVIAHPGIIKDVKPATNASYIFTTGGDDYTINIWKYNINPLIEAVENGGDGIKPFLNLLEGGMEGKKYKEMVDYFYYAQIKSKDENTTKHRVLDQTVAINCIHGLLASLGYYPSIEEINNIQREVRHMKHLENAKEKSDDINFETFVKIYLNHRPYIELDVDKIEDSFDNMKNQVKYHLTHDDNDTIIVRERLIECLQEIKYEDKKKDDKGVVTVELKRKVDDATIEAIIKELDENSNEQPITSIDHYQKKLHREKFLDLLKDYKIDDKDVDAMCFKLTGENMNNLPTTLLYKMGDRLISRENFLHMLKENGEKLTDEEIASILKVLVGDPDPTHLPPMLSFDYIFENILLMEKEDREVNK